MERRNDTEGKFKGFSSLATDEDCTEEGVGKDVKDKKIVYMALPIVLYSESLNMERPNRTPKQHKMLLERIVKIVRLFKPDDATSFSEWFLKIRNRYGLDR